jgi:predicted proteasome-type protease
MHFSRPEIPSEAASLEFCHISSYMNIALKLFKGMVCARTYKRVLTKHQKGDNFMKYVKRGSLAKSKANELLLVDEKKNAYKVDQSIIVVWVMCDGTMTVEQVVDEVAKETKVDKAKIKNVIDDILAKLEKAGLVKKVE